MPPTVLAPSLHEHAKSPAAILANAEQQWLFTEDELLLSPSVQAGMTPDKEREVRSKGIAFIRQVGIMLKLPEMTLSTAAIFFNRFFMRVSLVAKPPQKAIHHYVRRDEVNARPQLKLMRYRRLERRHCFWPQK